MSVDWSALVTALGRAGETLSPDARAAICRCGERIELRDESVARLLPQVGHLARCPKCKTELELQAVEVIRVWVWGPRKS